MLILTSHVRESTIRICYDIKACCYSTTAKCWLNNVILTIYEVFAQHRCYCRLYIQNDHVPTYQTFKGNPNLARTTKQTLFVINGPGKQ